MLCREITTMSETKPFKYTSNRSFLTSKTVDRRFIEKNISQKLRGRVSAIHVACVFGILLSEIINELITTGSVEIDNFGEFCVKQMPSRRHINLFTKEYVMSMGRKIVRLELNKKLKKILTNNVDIDKTFPGDDLKK